MVIILIKNIKILDIEDLESPYDEIANEVGIEATIKIATLLQGQQIYFPMLERSYGNSKRNLIRKEFNGFNYKELASKYSYSERWIRIVCDDLVQKERNKPLKNQINIFEV